LRKRAATEMEKINPLVTEFYSADLDPAPGETKENAA